MTDAQYEPDWGQYDHPGHDEELAAWEAAAARTRKMRQERLADGWNPGGRNTGRRTLTGAEALARVEELNPACPTPVMRRIAAEIETRAWLASQRIANDVDDDPHRCADWLGNHPPLHEGPR